MSYLSVSIKKLNALISDPNFKQVQNIVGDKIYIEMKCGKVCRVDRWGRCEWLEPESHDV